MIDLFRRHSGVSVDTHGSGGLDIDNLVHLVIVIAVVGAILWLLWWLISYFALPEPFAKIAKGIVALVGVIFLINLLLSLL